MNLSPAPEGPRPPVALGCFAFAAVVFVLFGIGACAVAFLESGAETGELRLEVEEAYAPGEVVFIGDRNVFLVRLVSGEFLAVRDLDAPNRASGGRCRVTLTTLEDASLPLDGASLRARFSPEAAGVSGVFREPCRDAVYDPAGALLTGEGPNLDRYAVAVDSNGQVVIDVSERTCSIRTERQVFSPATC